MLPSLTKVAHLPAVAAKMAVAGEVLSNGTTLLAEDMTVYVPDRFLIVIRLPGH